jgi:hypothetical protein
LGRKPKTGREAKCQLVKMRPKSYNRREKLLINIILIKHEEIGQFKA